MKWVKRIAMLIVALVLVAVLAAVAFVATFDPNDYKNRIAAVVKEKTGRTVHFNGDISVTIFPWLGATLKDVSLSNASGFAAKDMLEARKVEAKAALLPLIKGQFEIGTLVLDGAVINLQRKADGKTNWDDLIAHGQAPAKPAGTPGSAAKKPLALAVGGVDVRNATLHWQDGKTGQDVTLNKLHLTTGSLTPDEPVKVSSGFDYTLTLPDQPRLKGRFDLNAEVQANLPQQRARINDLELSLKANAEPTASGQKKVGSGMPQQAGIHLTAPVVQVSLAKRQVSLPAFTLKGQATRLGTLTYADGQVSGEVSADWGQQRYSSKELKVSGTIKGLPTRTGALEFEGSGGLEADLAQGTASAIGWRLASDPVVVKTSLKASGIGKALSVKGPVSIEPFSPRALAQEMKYTVPNMQSDKAMTHFSLQAQADVTPQQAMLDKLNVDLDGNRFTGKAGLSDLKTQKILAHIQGGKLNLNPYLPPAARKAAAEAPSKSGGGSLAGGGDVKIPLPVKALRKLNLDVRVKLAQLTYQDYVLGNPTVDVTAAGGRISLDKLALGAFGGQLDSHGSLDVRGAVPDWRGSMKTDGIKLQPLLKAAMNEDRLLGTGDLSLDLRAQGDRVSKLKSSLDGSAKFALKNGKIKGVDLGYLLRAAQAGIQGQTLSVPKQQETDFSSITGTAKIRNGVVHNDDLRGASPLLRVEGKGDVDLGRSTIDYLLKAIVVNTATGQQGKALEKLKQVPVPIKISGTFANPKYAVDLQSVLKDKAKQEVKQRVEKELKKNLGDKAAPVKNMLKGLGF